MVSAVSPERRARPGRRNTRKPAADIPTRQSRNAPGASPSAVRTDPAAVSATHRAWAEIDLDAIRDNVLGLLSLLSRGTRLMAVVKADAYGHGAVEVARTATEAGAWALGVATIDEGIELRQAGLTAPVLVLGPTLPEDADAAVRHDLGVTVFRLEVAQALSRAAARAGHAARVHLKVDTGMGRIGTAPKDAAALAREIGALAHVSLDGCFTHLATADETNLSSAREQLVAFRAALAALERAGLAPGLRHAANSAATMCLPEAHFDLVRCGIAVYGIAPAPQLRSRVRLRPAMRFCARIMQAKRVPAGTPVGYGHAYRAPRATTIATIPVGYADGYPRLAGHGGHVVLGERRLPIVGRISMDQITVDAGREPCAAGDEVELWGPTFSVEEVARAAQTIAYEVLAGVSRRIPRIFTRDGRAYSVRTLLDGGTG
jgi:alanine racemase